MLKLFWKTLGKMMTEQQLLRLFNQLCSILVRAQSEDSKNSKETRQLGTKRLAEFFELDLMQVKDWSFYSQIVQPRLLKLENEFAQTSSALIDMFVAWSKLNLEYFSNSPDLVPKIVDLFDSPQLCDSVHLQLLSIFDCFLIDSATARTYLGASISRFLQIAQKRLVAASVNPADNRQVFAALVNLFSPSLGICRSQWRTRLFCSKLCSHA